ncbi:hypothetical protein [Chlorogloeopsis fritschii]|uniref:hypothetical protein n=1 Tax=Chlorogloeopsis fritschii TaxID=1124 RepID=UPI00138AE707|nr:hypothetical protein [Chlorogloeopsis fritschii]
MTPVATTRGTRRQVTPLALCRGTRPPQWLLYAGEPVHPPGSAVPHRRKPPRRGLLHRTGSPQRWLTNDQ